MPTAAVYPAATRSATVRPVVTKADLKRFIHYPFKHYREDPHWVPPLLMSEWERFDPKRNPFYEHARMKLFVAERDGETVGRIAGIDDDNHNQSHGDNLAFFGFFEAADETVAAALFNAVESWARGIGRDTLRGPANPSMNDGSGFQIDAFDTDPYIMMPYNPADYPRYTEAAGFHKVKDLYAWHYNSAGGVTERLSRLADRVRRRYNPTVRPADMKRYREELGHLKRLYNGAWLDNWGFVKYTDAEFDHLANELKLIIDPDIALFIELGGEVVGVALALPDMNQILKRLNGRLLPFGPYYLLRRKHYITQARLPILGVKPEHRLKGLELVLMDEIAKRGRAKGYRGGELSWILEDNDGINKGIAAAGATLYKTYRLYEKAL